MADDEDTLTAYHEAGHALVGYALGGRIEQIQLGGFDDEDHLPRRFGECRVSWGRVDPQADWQLQRELLTILAGPVAEMIYRDEPVDLASAGPSQGDWAQAWEVSRHAIPHPHLRARMLEQITASLHRTLCRDAWWAAIAAVATDLLAHESLDQEQAEESLGFWVRRL